MRGWKELEGLLVREAMGMEGGEEEEEEEGAEGDADAEEDGNAENYEWVRRREQRGTARKRRGGASSVVKVADIELPNKAKKEGWKVVRQEMEQAEIVVKEELTDGWVV